MLACYRLSGVVHVSRLTRIFLLFALRLLPASFGLAGSRPCAHGTTRSARSANSWLALFLRRPVLLHRGLHPCRAFTSLTVSMGLRFSLLIPLSVTLLLVRRGGSKVILPQICTLRRRAHRGSSVSVSPLRQWAEECPSRTFSLRERDD